MIFHNLPNVNDWYKHLIKCYPCNILDNPEVISDGKPGKCQAFDNSFKNKNGDDTYGKPFLVCKDVGSCGKQATYSPYRVRHLNYWFYSIIGIIVAVIVAKVIGFI